MTFPGAPAGEHDPDLGTGHPGSGRDRVLHFIHHPVSARSFIVPLVAGLRARGVAAELWTEPQALGHPALAGVDIPMHPARVVLSAAPWISLWRWFRLVVALRRLKPVVVHAHQTRTSLIPLAAAACAGVPVRIYHNHGLPYLGYHGALRLLLRWFERINGALATHVLLVSHGNHAEAIRDGLFSGRPSAVLGQGSICGIALDDYAPQPPHIRLASRATWGIDAGAFVLGWVGRPHARKGLPLLLAAWSRAGCAQSGAILLLAGCSADECRTLCGDLPPGVKALGYVAIMPAFYRCCDAVVLVSLHEGVSYALLEGGASGCALIGSDIPGTRDVIVHTVTGLLVEPEVEPVAQAIALLSGDRGLCARLGAAARERTEQLFDRERVVEALYRYYRQNLGVGRER